MATANKIIEKDNIFVRPYLSANNPKIYEPIHIPIVVAKVKFPASAVVSPKSLIIKNKIYDKKERPVILVNNGIAGGNQQKMIIARELNLSPDFLVIAQPTRGLDVGAIEYIRQRIIEERDKGRAILLISFELDEIMNLCDRIATISKGTIVGIFKEGEVTEREIGIMMAGSKKQDKEVSA